MTKMRLYGFLWRLAVPCFAAAVWILPAAGQDAVSQEDSGKYATCLTLVEENAGAALDYARAWNIEARGLAGARHCEALALLALDRAREAAVLLEQEAERVLRGAGVPDRTPDQWRALSTELFIQAALAWRQDKNPDKAYSAISSALAGARTGAASDLVQDLYLERGRLQRQRREYDAALEDFTLAIELDPERASGYLERARLFRHKRHYPAARLDLKAAAEITPGDPEILLESGILYRLEGKKAQARQEWEEIIARFPDGEVAAAARENIRLLNR